MAEHPTISIDELYSAFQGCTGIAIDSRKVKPGDMFFALKGEHSDGHLYVEGAIERGAHFAIIEDPAFKRDNDKCLLVNDVLLGLQDLARHHRQRFNIPVIGITGSNGKTTSKELLAAVLSEGYQCHFTKGNFNNHIGVPLTLLAMPEETEVAVIEMGANHVGEIKELCEIALPTHGIITNIGKAHLEGFGGVEGVKQGKSELYRFLHANNGVAFINKDEAFLSDLSEFMNHRRVFYGIWTAEEKELWLRGQGTIIENDCIRLKFWNAEDQEFVADTQLIGQYNLPNLITATALGLYFKVEASSIKKVLEEYVPKANRSQLIQNAGQTLILDAYNANPTSMEKALKNLAAMTSNSKVAILGSMKELGDFATAEHERILDLAMEQAFEKVLTVGEEFQAAAAKHELPNFADVEALKDQLPAIGIDATATILIKGSRSIRLEELVEVLTQSL